MKLGIGHPHRSPADGPHGPDPQSEALNINFYPWVRGDKIYDKNDKQE